MARDKSSSAASTLAALLAGLSLLGGTGAVAAASGPSESVVWAFGHANREPTSGLIADRSGNLYGEVSSGSGVVYELSPPSRPGGAWSSTLIHRFFGGFYGCSPFDGLILDGAGNLYGIAGCGYNKGGGIVFELARPTKPGGAWTESVLYAFKPNSNGTGDGEYPHGRLAFDALGNLYGTTVYGGKTGYGAIYELSPPARRGQLWNETLLHNFARNDLQGYFPDHGVTLGAAGVIYGTAGSNAFSLTPPGSGGSWTYSVIHTFTGNDGDSPECELVFDASGNLYGTTEYGGVLGEGVVFELSPPARGHAWTEKVLYSFPKFAGDSGYIYAGVLLDGTGGVYGTSQVGGTLAEGTVFHLTPPPSGNGEWTETISHSFVGGSDGGYPIGALIYGADGRIYGARQYGGVGSVRARASTGAAAPCSR
jgi:uncharacterized repeat protein (TIGR03803 family)